MNRVYCISTWLQQVKNFNHWRSVKTRFFCLYQRIFFFYKSIKSLSAPSIQLHVVRGATVLRFSTNRNSEFQLGITLLFKNQSFIGCLQLSSLFFLHQQQPSYQQSFNAIMYKLISFLNTTLCMFFIPQLIGHFI